MEVIGHERIGVNRDCATYALVVKELEEKPVIRGVTEHSPLVVATLDDVLSEPGNADARLPGHANSLSQTLFSRLCVNVFGPSELRPSRTLNF
jgi:hypothetical protein